MHGVLVVDKPKGPTSFDVVKRVRFILKVKKAGHTGTLDPMATGVLPICLEDATKVAGLITEGDKAYEATLRLGATTDTLDAEGKLLSERPVPALDEAAIEAVLAKFRGTFEQTPPMFSAVKVAGRRLYELAREGEEVERKSRTVTVHALTLRGFGPNELRLFVHCGKGFFVRTLASEIGEALGCGAHLVELRRTRSGPFSDAQAVTIDQLEKLPRQAVEAKLVSMGDALSQMPSVKVSAEDVRRVCHGIPLDGVTAAASGKLRVLGPEGELLAIGEVDATKRLRYARVLVQR